MQEWLPIAMGVVIGLAVQKLPAPRLRAALLVGLCVVCGAIASFVAGELEVTLGFIPVDALLVWVGALVAVGLAALWRRRTTVL
jgi:fucose permease